MLKSSRLRHPRQSYSCSKPGWSVPPSLVSALMFTKVPDSALQTEVLFPRTDAALAEAVGTSHGSQTGMFVSAW